MRNIKALAATLFALIVLAACSPGAIFSMEGEYDMLLTITESTNPTFPVGDTDSSVAEVTTTGDDVVMDLGGFLGLVGTRSGNSVTLTGSLGGDDIQMSLVWTSDDAFEGTGRIDYADTTYVEFDVDGQAVVAITSLGGAAVFGAGD